MTERATKYLSDVLWAIGEIEDFTRDTKTFAAYEANRMLRTAVERLLAIIGEAINHYRREPESIPLAYTRQIVQLRNRLVHAYDSVDHSVIWRIIRNEVPLLREEVKNLLAQTD